MMRRKRHNLLPQAACSSAAGRCVYLGLVLLGTLFTSSSAVPDFTCFNARLYIRGDEKTFFGGFKSGSDLDATVSLGRELDTGSGSDLPVGGYEDDVSFGSVVKGTRYWMPASIGEDRFGVYNCIFGDQSIKITTIVMNENGDVSPASPTLTTSAGEDVTLTMTQLYNGPSTELRWKHNGNDVTAWNGQSSITINNVQAINAGIYECYRDGRYSQQKHALMKLIVRECSSPNKWGSSCDNDCPLCYNGGVCDDITGECICAPGFSGPRCTTLHGKNCFGQNCGITCSSSNPDVGCNGYLMCLPDPFGCTCAAGFTGSNCMADCVNGSFGAGCKMRCHCDGDAVCDKDNGKCPTDVQCASGFTGENCQVCPDGFFGATCAQECHCAGDVVCDKGNGRCPDGAMCKTGYRGDNCQNSCPYGMIGLQPECIICYVPIAVSNLVISEPDTSIIKWKAPQNKCPVIDYVIQFQLVNRDQCRVMNGEFESVANTSVREFTLRDADSSLYAYSTYKIRVLARNEAGLGEYQDENHIEYTSSAKEPSTSPADFHSTSKSRHNIELTWSEIPCGQRNGDITEYTIHLKVLEKPYNISFKPQSTYQSVIIPHPRMQHNITGLEPSTKYEFLLAGVNAAGTGEQATLEAFTLVETEIDPPSKPSNRPSKSTPSTVTIGLHLPTSSPYITGIQIGVQQSQPVVKREATNSISDVTPDYVAAELRKENLPETFIVGDGKTYGGFDNKPLESSTEYDIYLGSVSRISDTEYFVAWGESLRVKVPESSFPVTAVVIPVLILVVIGCLAATIIKMRQKARHRKAEECVLSDTVKDNVYLRDRTPAEEEETSYSTIADRGPAPVTSQPPPRITTKPKPKQFLKKTSRPSQDNVRTKKEKTVKDSHGFLSDSETSYENAVSPQDKLSNPSEYEKVGLDQPSEYEQVAVGSSSTYEDIGLPGWAKPWSVLWSDMMVASKVLGEGHFGEVRLGGVMKEGDIFKAAIKTLKTQASPSDRNNFMEEFRAMTQVGRHPNIIRIIGACQHEDVLYIAMEYLPNGDLRSYLRKARSTDDDSEASLSSEKLIQFALGVAKGMQHLATSGVIHRDLAARNILLDNNLVAKVSDFGLSRGEDIYVQTSKTRVPARWLSLESLSHQTYTSKSDVWSFGILLWEIATLGGTPYSGIKSHFLASRLRNGYRMPKPRNCNNEIYDLMLNCWREDPNNRPPFRTLVSILTTMADNHIEHTYMQLPLKSESYVYENICPDFDDN